MKKLTSLLLFLVLVLLANAQTRTDSIQVAYDKIDKLEKRLSNQDAQIANLLQKVDEVTRQNLALKKNLNLTPTIASAKAGDIMEYRIIEVTGDTATNTVHMVMIADNICGEQKGLMYWSKQVIDDQGHGFENSLMKERFKMSIDGVCNSLLRQLLNHYPNAPYTIDVYLYDVNPTSEYIKLLSLEVTEGSKHYTFTFENLPIKWNK